MMSGDTQTALDLEFSHVLKGGSFSKTDVATIKSLLTEVVRSQSDLQTVTIVRIYHSSDPAKSAPEISEERYRVDFKDSYRRSILPQNGIYLLGRDSDGAWSLHKLNRQSQPKDGRFSR